MITSINDNKKCLQKNVNGDHVKVEEDKENIYGSNGFGEKRNNIEKVSFTQFTTYFNFWNSRLLSEVKSSTGRNENK